MKNKILLLAFISQIAFTIVSGQNFDPNALIPTDTSIIIKTLPNGLKYYIKKNIRPEKRMDIRLVVNAGSILEDSDQVGLAHFTEHMAFNGTKHFEKNKLISYLQSMGIKFGPEINAYTGFDETVYILQLPTDSASLKEKGFEILSDWAQNISFDSTEIEKERGVIIEEWRLGRGAEQRMMDKYFPVLFYNSKYANRLPIGTKESLESFKRNQITRFYSKWYRPNNMAIVAVGDFDVNEIENLIIKYFSGMTSPQMTEERPEFNLPPHKEMLVSVNSDKEANETVVNLYYKLPFKQEFKVGDYQQGIKRMLYFQMLNGRFDERLRKPNPPCIYAGSTMSRLGRKNNAYILSALVSEDGISKGLQALIEENTRVRKFGFTASELDRAKSEILTLFEKYYNERDKSESEQFSEEYARNFLTKESIPGIVFEFNLVKHTLPQISLEEINSLPAKWLSDSNRVIIVTAPEKEGLIIPSKDSLIAVVNKTEASNIEPYKDVFKIEKLIDKNLKAQKISKESKNKETEITTIEFANGIKINYKQTNFKDNEVLFSSISKGGQSLYADKDMYSALFCTSVIEESGIGKFSADDLRKMLAGKSVSVSPYINQYTEGVKASCTPKDMETMFQLIYLYYTAPKIDTLAYQSWYARIKSYLVNVMSDPMVYYSEQVSKILSQNNPRGSSVPKPEDIDKIDLNKVLNIYKERFADANDFSYTICGNFNVDSLKKYASVYLANLPVAKGTENYNDLGIRPPKELTVKDIYKGSDPKSMVTAVITDTITYNAKQAYYLRSLEDYLDIRLYEVLREEMSGVYGVGASCSMTRIPYQYYTISFKIPCSPTNTDSLVKEAFHIVDLVKQNGIDSSYMTKIKETQLRELEVSEKTNGFWLSYIENSMLYGDDVKRILNKKADIEKLSSSDIQNITKRVFKPEYIRVTLYPEKKE